MSAMRIAILGCLLMFAALNARADWHEQNGQMWGSFTEQARLAYIQGYYVGSSGAELNCHMNVLKRQVKEKLSAEQLMPLNSLCDSGQRPAVTDDELVARMTAFYGEPKNGRILIAHALDIVVMGLAGESPQTLESLTDIYRVADSARAQ
jgi:hypothetical protein